MLAQPLPCHRFSGNQRPVHEILGWRRPCNDGNTVCHARLDHRGGQVGPGGTVRDAEKLLIRPFAVVCDEPLAPELFRLLRPRLTLRLADLAIQPIGEGIIQRRPVQRVVALPGPDILDQFVKGVVLAIVGGKDRYGTAPHKQRHCSFNQLGKVIDECGFVDNDPPLFRAQGTRLGRQAPDVETGSKTDAVNGDVPIGIPQHDLFRITDCGIKDFCPIC